MEHFKVRHVYIVIQNVYLAKIITSSHLNAFDLTFGSLLNKKSTQFSSFIFKSQGTPISNYSGRPSKQGCKMGSKSDCVICEIAIPVSKWNCVICEIAKTTISQIAKVAKIATRNLCFLRKLRIFILRFFISMN